jgi:RNA polymerase sigma-B factor
VSARDERRVNDPLDLESLPGQARRIADDEEEAEGAETAHDGPSADREGRGKADSEKLDQFLLRVYHSWKDSDDPQVVDDPVKRKRAMEARQQLITMYLPLVRSLARRYASRGEHFDDLVQVGAIGLIKAIDRFDLERGVELTTYATPNIVGEIKRYFRDKGWSVRVPRGLQELNIRLNKVIDELVPKLQRSPTINELAEAANATPEEVLEALETSQAYNSVSLQASPNGESGEEDAGLIDYLGGEEEAYDTMEDRTTLAPGFAKLDKRERYILHLRFFEGLTQSQIAERVGISQMHVSRLIRRSLEKLREEIGDLDNPLPPRSSDDER